MSSAGTTTFFQRAREHLVRVAEDLIVSVIAAGVVAALAMGWIEQRLETSKTHVEMLVASQQKFDDAHNDVLAQFGIYANKLLMQKNDTAQRERIYAAIISAQSQLLSLHHELGDRDIAAIRNYATDLNSLSDSIREIKHREELGPAYEHVQRLLADREAVDDSVKGNLRVKVF